MRKHDTIFLSSWDKDGRQLDLPDSFLWPAIRQFSLLKNEYFFSDEMEQYKHSVFKEELFSGIGIENIGVFSNGTVAATLALMALQEISTPIRALLIAPIYFTYIRTLHDLNADIYFCPASIRQNNRVLPMEAIQREIKQNKINLVIITYPLFGTGISPSNGDMEELCQICQNLGSYLLLDYLYGGMLWSGHNDMFSRWLQNLIFKYKNIIAIESLSKRVFLNGIKVAIVEAPAELVHIMEIKSVYLVGSLSYSQVTIMQELYGLENRPLIESIIKRNINYFSSNYELIRSQCTGSPVTILPCAEGYFCLASVPMKLGSDSTNIAKQIMQYADVLTIPHNRYLYFTPQEYTFRINLSLKQDMLLTGIERLLQVDFDSID